MKELYEKTLATYENILLGCILAIMAAELLYGIYGLAIHSYNFLGFLTFLVKKCLLPTILNFIVLVATKIIIDNPNVIQKYKSYATFVSLAIIVTFETIIHNQFASLWAAFALPVMVSAIFGKKEYLRLATEASILGVLIAFCVRLFALGMDDNKGEVYYVIHLYIALVMLVFAVLLSSLIMHVVETSQEFMIFQAENQADLREQVNIDAMTGLYNHSAFYTELSRQIKESDKNKVPLSIAVSDIDNFKLVNDFYGHARGDQVLVALSELMKEKCADYTVCRYGGEEFAVIFYGLKYKEAVMVMEDVLEAFRNMQFEWCDHPITFSCGVCQHYDIRINAESLFAQADKYLYKAKQTGKNKVVCE